MLLLFKHFVWITLRNKFCGTFKSWRAFGLDWDFLQRFHCIIWQKQISLKTSTMWLKSCYGNFFGPSKKNHAMENHRGVAFNQHCHKISTVLHHIGFRSTSLLLFTLNIFNISTVFTLNELSSPLFFHQHGFQSTLFSLNTAYHLH